MIACPMSTNSDLLNSLKYICKITQKLEGDWVIIGSVAACLSGADLVPKDVDFCASALFVETLIGCEIGQNAIKTGQKIFSNPYVTIPIERGLPIDFMGDLSVFDGNKWQKLVFKSRKTIKFDFGDIYIPEIWEQIEILKTFGRAKDLAKLPLLQKLL
ncbi:MAG: Uncharacterized protein FD163_1149 [Hyphomonadaceae bacterium]|nr:MAG: Uncharacterized protein FD128_2033 [Hyphomonadaceae bacterium]KAF0185334.1 MAG: Uncharacterized protein FD163_1149 [Hyphomonadaceae bacterium]